MKRYLLISIILVMLVGCTANDSFFGNDMLPPSQEMYTSIDSNMTLETFVVSLDSVPSNDKAAGSVGSTFNPFLGRTDISFMATYAPTVNETNRYYGKDLRTDSMTVHLRIERSHIDEKNPIEISVYELNGVYLRHDKGYFTNFNPKPYYDESKPLATFTYLKNPYATVDSVRFNLPRSFFDKLVDPEYLKDNPKSPYASDTSFIKTFNGLFFMAKPVNSGRGNVIIIPMAGCSMSLYYRINTLSSKPDTLIRKFQFYSASSAPYNTTITVAKHDYTLADPSQGGVRIEQINDTINPSGRCYIQGYGGLGTRIKVDTTYIRGMNEAARAKGYTSIALHKAEIRWYVPALNLNYYNDIFSRLGLFSWKNGKMGYIPDYDPVSEINYNYTSPFGRLQRAMGYYSMDVTSSMQRLFSNRSKLCIFNMTPDFKQLLNPFHSVVGGSKSVEAITPQIILTYTLIK